VRARLLALPLTLPLGLLLLTGCASSPEAEVREGVRSVLAAANDQDADAVRTAVDDLLATLREQVGSQELTDAEAAPVRDAALAIRESVSALDEVEETPTPTPEPTEEPEPTQEPEPTEEPTPTPTPEPTQEPEPTVEPEPTQEPEQTEPPQETQPPEDDGEDDGEGGGDDQATVVPQLPAFTQTPGPTPTA
jgi:outer membrane biosynthesis protein TonB